MVQSNDSLALRLRVGQVTCVFLIFWSQHKVLGPAWGRRCFVLLHYNHFYTINGLKVALSPSSSVSSFFSSSDLTAVFLKLKLFFMLLFSLFGGSSNELSVRRCFPAGPSAVRPAVRGNVFCWIHCGKREQREKIAISLIPFPVSSPFCVFVLIPRCAMVLPTQRCCSQLAPLHCAAGLFLNLCGYKHG